MSHLAKLCTFGLICSKTIPELGSAGAGLFKLLPSLLPLLLLLLLLVSSKEPGACWQFGGLGVLAGAYRYCCCRWRGNRQPSQVTSHQGFVSPPMHARNSHPTQALSPEPLQNPNFGTSLSGRALQLVVHNDDIPGALSLKPRVQLCSKINT